MLSSSWYTKNNNIEKKNKFLYRNNKIKESIQTKKFNTVMVLGFILRIIKIGTNKFDNLLIINAENDEVFSVTFLLLVLKDFIKRL